MKRIFIALLGGFFCQFLSATWEPFPGALRYDEVCHFTSHNSYAAQEHGYLYAQQNLSIEKQLALGVRGLMLDICEGKHEILLCHKGPFLTRLICRGKDPMPFHTSLDTIRKFLEENPKEVLTIFLENYVKSKELLDSEFSNTGLKDYILTEADWNPQNKGWPTFTWMRENNKRLVIFNSLGKTELCFDEWRHVIENQWGTLHPVKACRERPESKAWRNEERSLYLLNYFPYFNLSFDNSYAKINTEGLDTFIKRALEKGLDTGSHKTLLPTFLCIDYIDVGNGMKHVQEINRRKHTSQLALIKHPVQKPSEA